MWSTEVLLAVFGAFSAWCAYNTVTRFSDRKENWQKFTEIENNLTRLGERDHVSYRELVSTLDEKIDPVRNEINELTSLVHAIAIKEGVEPDRRSK